MRTHHAVIGCVFGALTLMWIGFLVDAWHQVEADTRSTSVIGLLYIPPMGLVGFMLIWLAAWGCDALWDRYLTTIKEAEEREAAEEPRRLPDEPRWRRSG